MQIIENMLCFPIVFWIPGYSFILSKDAKESTIPPTSVAVTIIFIIQLQEEQDDSNR